MLQFLNSSFGQIHFYISPVLYWDYSRYKIMYIMGKIVPRAYKQPPRPFYETLGFVYISLGDDFTHDIIAVSYTHLTLPTTPYV